MTDFSAATRNRLYNDARHRVAQVDRAPTPEIAQARRFIAFGVILGLIKAGALAEDSGNELLRQLQVTDPPELGEAFQTVLSRALLPDQYPEQDT